MVRIHQDSHQAKNPRRGRMANEKADKKEKAKERRPQAKKRDLQNEKSRLRNRVFKSQVRTAIRHLEDSLEKKDSAAAKAQLNEAYSLMDKGVKRGIFKLNKAKRTKSRLAARLAKV